MTRISYKETAPGAYQAMLGLERYVGKSELEQSLLELVRTRASQINGCAFCLDMHSKDALAAGETPQRLLVLSTLPKSAVMFHQLGSAEREPRFDGLIACAGGRRSDDSI